MEPLHETGSIQLALKHNSTEPKNQISRKRTLFRQIEYSQDVKKKIQK